jgi:hypothetical protein
MSTYAVDNLLVTLWTNPSSPVIALPAFEVSYYDTYENH